MSSVCVRRFLGCVSLALCLFTSAITVADEPAPRAASEPGVLCLDQLRT